MTEHLLRGYVYYTACRCITTCQITIVLAMCCSYAIVSSVSATEAEPKTEVTLAHPLEPPDTSGPRATLKTFLNFSSEGWRFFQEHGERHATTENFVGCCLDLSKIPEIQQQDIDVETAIMLFDVFNRIPLPKLQDVPDKDEMDCAAYADYYCTSG